MIKSQIALFIFFFFSFFSACGPSNDDSHLKFDPGLDDIQTVVAHVESFSDVVQRNEQITAQYHIVSEALNRYLNLQSEIKVPNWFSFSQHASHQAGTYMFELQKALSLFSVLHGPKKSTHDRQGLMTIVEELKKIQDQKDLVGSFLKIYLVNAGIDLDKGVLAAAPAIILSLINPSKLRADLQKVEASLSNLYNGLAEVNFLVFKSVTPSAYEFLKAAALDGENFSGSLDFENDDHGIKQACYQLYFQIARHGDAMSEASRRSLVHQANILLGAFEQMTAQAGLEKVKHENEMLKGSLKIVDPIGIYPLLKENWSSYERRMALVVTEPFEFLDLNPEFVLDHVDDTIVGTIPGYFRERTLIKADARIFNEPGKIL